MRVVESAEQDTDLHRLNDLVQQHGLSCRWAGNCYYFDDRAPPDAFSDGCIYTAKNLQEALAFAEGFDRAARRVG